MKPNVFWKIFLFFLCFLILTGGIASVGLKEKEDKLLEKQGEIILSILGEIGREEELLKGAEAEKLKGIIGVRGETGEYLYRENLSPLEEGTEKQIRGKIEKNSEKIGVKGKNQENQNMEKILLIKKGQVYYEIRIPLMPIEQYFLSLIPFWTCFFMIPFLALYPAVKRRIQKEILSYVEEGKKIATSKEGEGEETPYEEINDFVKSFHHLSEDVVKQTKAKQLERKKSTFILENLTQGVVLLDRDKRIFFINERALEYFGIQGKARPKKLENVDFQKELLDEVEKTCSTGVERKFQTVREGYHLEILVKKGDKFIQNQKVLRTGYLMMITDVTEMNKLMEQKQEFFSNASHELKTPITTILGFSQLLEQGYVKEGKKQQEYVVKIREQTEKLVSLVEDILKISHLNEWGEPGKEEPIQVWEKVEEVVSQLKERGEKKGITFAYNPGEIWYKIEEKHWEDVVLNLVENGIKYNKQGGEVKITLEEKEKTIEFVVADTGIGIPEEHQEEVFLRFFRVDKSRTSTFDSTGLGLAIVKHTVGLYKGEVRCTSKLGEGTAITVTLPKG